MDKCPYCGRQYPGKAKGCKLKAIGRRQGALLARLGKAPMPIIALDQSRVMDTLVERGLARKAADSYIITTEGAARL